MNFRVDFSGTSKFRLHLTCSTENIKNSAALDLYAATHKYFVVRSDEKVTLIFLRSPPRSYLDVSETSITK
jgi:hypothetical protein